MPKKTAGLPAARQTDGVAGGIIIQGEETVLIGGTAKPVACKECKARQLQGNPVNASYGSKILPQEIDFALPAPMPFAWERFYASDTPFTGLLGQGWRTSVEIHCEVDAQRIRLVDIQGRWIDFAALAAGEEQFCPSEGIWLARGTTDSTVAWEERWQWLPQEYRHNPQYLIATPGEGDYLIFEAAHKPVPAREHPAPVAGGRHDLVALVNRHGYTTRLHWADIRNEAGQIMRVPEFISDSAKRIYRLHCSALPENRKRDWNSHHPQADCGIRLAALSLAHDPQSASDTPKSWEVLRQQHPSEYLVHYRYSEAGDLIEVQDGDGDWSRRFEYRQHLMTRQQTPGGTEDASSLDVRYEYDRYDDQGKVVRQIQSGGLTLEFAYGETSTDVSDNLGRVTRYRFEGAAGLKRLVQLTHPDGESVRTDYTRDGQISKRTDQLGRATHFRHDGDGSFLGSTNPLGHSQQRFRDPATGLVSSIRNAAGQITRIRHDARGRVERITAADGSKTQFIYEHPYFPDRPTAIIDARGGRKTQTYNTLGQLASFTDCSGQITRYHHDGKGRLQSIEAADGKRQTFQHDKKGRIIAVTWPDASQETFRYDRAGRLIRVTGADGRPVEMSYDRYGRITEHRLWSAEQSPDRHADGASWAITRYQYDAAGRLVRLTDPAGAMMGFGYDTMDRLIHEGGFDGKQSAYRYDVAGQLVSQTDAAGTADAIEIRNIHDAAGRLIARHIPAFNGSPAQQYRFTYNPLGQLTSAVTADSQVDFSYNQLGQLSAETQSTPDGHSQTLRFAYDILGNRTQLILPDGQIIDTLLYGSGHWHQIAFNGHPLIDVERDSLHREISRTYGSGTADMVAHALMRKQAYTALGQLDKVRHTRADKSIGQRQHQYDASGLLTRIDVELDGLRSIVRYGYDTRQHLCAWDRHAVFGHGSGQPEVRQTHVQHYAHDRAGNPIVTEGSQSTIRQSRPAYATPEQWAEQVKSHGAAADFNLLGQNGARANRITHYDGVQCSHDERGNVISRKTAEGHWSFAWNALNQMTASCFTPAGASEPDHGVAYHYDAFGRRIGKFMMDVRGLRYDANGDPQPDSLRQVFTRFLWDGDRMVQEIHARHAKTIVYEPGGFVPLAQVVQARAERPQRTSQEQAAQAIEQHSINMLLDNSALLPQARQAILKQLANNANKTDARIHLFVNDHLGTPQRMIDARTHETVWAREQDPWGNTTSEIIDEGLPEECIPNLRFQGQQWDGEIGLCYNRYRYYDSRVHRYVSQDPIGLMGGLNLYAYPTNPVQRIDPLGLSDITGDYPGVENVSEPIFQTTDEIIQSQPISAKVMTDIKNGQTTFWDPYSNKSTTFETRNAVASSAKEGAAGPYSGAFTTCEYISESDKKHSKEYGTVKWRTTDPRSRWIHGGGTGLSQPRAPRQGWKPTLGCTRAQNEDVEKLCEQSRKYLQDHPGGVISYERK